MIGLDSVTKEEELEGYPELSGDYRFVFNTDRFLHSKQIGGAKILRYSIRDVQDRPISISVAVLGKEALSGYQATFGGVDADVIDERTAGLLEEVEEDLAQSGVENLVIRVWPDFVDDGLFSQLLLSRDYRIKNEEVNQHLEVTRELLTEKMSKEKNKKLRLCQKEGFTFRQLPASYLPQVYELIVDARVRKQYPVTMSYSELLQVVRKLPEKFRLFGVFDGDILIASAVNIILNKNISYNFYHGDHRDYSHFSPTTMLVEGIYRHSQKENRSFLDLGVSTVDGEVNHGLYTFKKRLGCLDSAKRTFIKQLI